MFNPDPDPDTGYCESAADLAAQEHEEAEEAEFFLELATPAADMMPAAPFYLELAADLLKEVA